MQPSSQCPPLWYKTCISLHCSWSLSRWFYTQIQASRDSFCPWVEACPSICMLKWILLYYELLPFSSARALYWFQKTVCMCAGSVKKYLLQKWVPQTWFCLCLWNGWEAGSWDPGMVCWGVSFCLPGSSTLFLAWNSASPSVVRGTPTSASGAY